MRLLRVPILTMIGAAGLLLSQASPAMAVTSIPLHNNTAGPADGCPSGAWWHFVLTPNNGSAAFGTITLNVGGTTYTFTGDPPIVDNASQEDNVFVPVPAGHLVTDLETSGSSTTWTGSQPSMFVLSGTCDTGTPGTTTTTSDATTTTQQGTTTTLATTTTMGTTTTVCDEDCSTTTTESVTTTPERTTLPNGSCIGPPIACDAQTTTTAGTPTTGTVPPTTAVVTTTTPAPPPGMPNTGADARNAVTLAGGLGLLGLALIGAAKVRTRRRG